MQETRLAFKDVKKTSYVALVAALVALHVILRFIPGPWRTMSILMEPLEGIIAGPAGGFVAGLLGSVLGRPWRLHLRAEDWNTRSVNPQTSSET